jgi:hypothetical protein
MLAAGLPLTSPRLMGEMFYGAGKVVGGNKKMINAMRQQMGDAALQGLSPTQLNALAPAMMTNTNQLSR